MSLRVPSAMTKSHAQSRIYMNALLKKACKQCKDFCFQFSCSKLWCTFNFIVPSHVIVFWTHNLNNWASLYNNYNYIASQIKFSCTYHIFMSESKIQMKFIQKWMPNQIKCAPCSNGSKFWLHLIMKIKAKLLSKHKTILPLPVELESPPEAKIPLTQMRTSPSACDPGHGDINYEFTYLITTRIYIFRLTKSRISADITQFA